MNNYIRLHAWVTPTQKAFLEKEAKRLTKAAKTPVSMSWLVRETILAKYGKK